MTLGQFEPEVWIPRSHPAAGRGVIGLDELAVMDLIHGPRPASTATYDRWLTILRATDPRFGFTDPRPGAPCRWRSPPPPPPDRPPRS